MKALLLFSSSRCTSISRTGSDIRKWQMSRSLLLFPFFSFWSIWKWENGVEVIDHLAEPTPPLSIYYRPLFCRNKTISDGNYQMFCFFSDRTLNKQLNKCRHNSFLDFQKTSVQPWTVAPCNCKVPRKLPVQCEHLQRFG